MIARVLPSSSAPFPLPSAREEEFVRNLHERERSRREIISLLLVSPRNQFKADKRRRPNVSTERPNGTPHPFVQPQVGDEDKAGGRDFYRRALIAGANSSERARFMCERRAYASVSIIKSCVITGGVTGRGASLVRGTDETTIVNHRRIGRHVNLVSNARPRVGSHYQRAFKR